LASINAGASNLVQSQIATTLGMSSGDAVQDRHVWIKPFGSNLKQDASSSGSPGFKAVTSGVAVGTDRRLDNADWRVGFALSYGTSKVDDTSANPGSIDISSWLVTGYGSHRISEDTQLNFMGGVGFNDNNSSRTVPLVATTYAGKYNSLHGLLDAELQWARKVSDATSIIPSVHLSYSTLQSDSYTETPSDNAALKVDSNTTESFILGVGTRFVHSLESHGRWIGHLEAGYELVDKPTSLTSTFAAGGPSFVTSGATPSRSLIKAGLTYQQVLSNGSEVTARFESESRELFSGNSLSVNWRLPF
jgi:outer membrane autotransporter protein